ncbi:Putative undecaprenyl-phosphate N-acetylgalactosaminyl 1-phosphate transferase [Rosistilla ulvae]|uniref:Undecaprenyl-phosphate N-acetylgalactosaminyl 1-phosphate transferase n=1 Tax=Rosistilla ulvae TaxID=1930277 RepID=A0A517M0E7_9BACT|nr:sugar transferase [Rosistilla ulvae]QDS88358.1 Putative undecaprenyl-phosphate N-acetylgalactosaminyl 1-phosphate transferase [Rosistilla ulvae]
MLTIEDLLPEAAYANQEDSSPPLALPRRHRRYRYFVRKNRLERIVGTGLLVITAPVIGICWAIVRLTSKGPGIFRQKRVGRGGDLFWVYKLRTMRIDAEANGPQWSSGRDPRITSVGHVLRKLHLDELPQLVNVMRGEMALVGPRPERPEFVDFLREEIAGYERRLIVRPGITGLAQINLPPDSDLRSVERKQTLDLEHIDHANAWLDLRMILLTALRVCFLRGQWLTYCMGLDRSDRLKHLPATNANSPTVSLQELLETSQRRKEWAATSADVAWEQSVARIDPASPIAVRPR